MIELYKEIDDKLRMLDYDENTFDNIMNQTWIHMVNPSYLDVNRVCAVTGLDKGMLQGALDTEEVSHVDVDGDNVLITIDAPILIDGFYETVPFAIMYNKRFFVTMCSKDCGVVDSLTKKFRKIEPQKHARISLLIMYIITTMYIQSLKNIDLKSNEIEADLQDSMKNSHLFELMRLNKSLVYFSTSLNSNKNTLAKVKRLNDFKAYEADFDLLDDVEIENNQAIEMCQIHRSILDTLTDTTASVISNNLNNVMKILTIVTIVISIPTLIGSFWGMNVSLPFENNKYGFWILIALSTILTIIGGWLLYKVTGVKKAKKK